MKGTIVVAALISAALHVVHAQHAGPNFNVNVLTTDPRTGDGYLQRQVEPSIAVSPLNPEIVMAAANDYRLISHPNDQGVGEGDTLETLVRRRVGPDGTRLLAAEPVRDTWIGLYTSIDRGKSWMNMLHPGHPFDQSPLGLSLPIYGRTAATDPVLAAFGRHFFLTALFFDRGGNSQLTVSRFTNLNNETAHPVVFDFMREIDRGSQTSGGYFVDKPHIAVDQVRPGVTTGECSVYVAFTVFNGSSQSHVRVSRSHDCGVTWGTPKNVANPGIRNQGANIAVDPRNGTVYVVWRTFNPNHIMVSRSTNGGASWTAPASLTGAAQLCAYDQPTCPIDGARCGSVAADLARSLGLPSAAVDGAGRLHVVWQERVNPIGLAFDATACFANANATSRIVMSTSTDRGGTWSARRAVDMAPRCEEQVGTRGARDRPCAPGEAGRTAGAQTKPSIARTGDRLMVIYKEARGLVDPATGYPLGRDRQYDLRAALLDAATGARVGSTQVSRYAVDPEGKVAAGADDAPNVSRDNLPMYKGGFAAFSGDYELVTPTTTMVRTPSGWRWADAADAPLPSFMAAWYDTRDVVFPRDGQGNHSINGAWTLYDSPGAGTGSCNPGSRDANIYVAEIDQGLVVSARTNFRRFGQQVNQVSYAIGVKNTTEQNRTYELRLREGPGVDASFAQDEHIQELAAANGKAKRIFANSEMLFTVFATGPDPSPPDAIRVEVNDTSTPQNPDAVLRLNPDPTNAPVRDSTTTSRETHRASIGSPTVFTGQVAKPGTTNPDFGNPDFGNPDFGNPDFGNPDFGNATLGETGYTEYTDASFTVTNTDGNVVSAYTPFLLVAEREALLKSHRLQVIVSRTVKSGAASGCDAVNNRTSQVISSAVATIENPDFGNPDFGNPDFGNPDFGNPSYGNPDFGNPDFGNPDFGNFSFAIAPDEVSGASHQPEGPTHSPRPVERVTITIRAWHCRVAGQCGPGVIAEDPAQELFPTTPAQVGGRLTVLVVPQARDNDEGVLQPHPNIAAFGPDLVVEGNPSLGQTTYAPGAVIVVPSWAEANRGTARALGRKYAYYLSADAALSSDDTRLAQFEMPDALEPNGRRVIGGDSAPIPSGIAEGSYYLLIVVDDSQMVAEVDEANNVFALPLAILHYALSIQQQPNDVEPGMPIAPAVRVLARDAAGAVVPSVAVSMSAVVGGVPVALGGTTTATTDASGVATFADLTIDGEATGVHLVATAGDPRSESNAFNVGSISFEIYPDDGALGDRRAKPTCEECQVLAEFASRGLTVTFTRDGSVNGGVGVATSARLLETTQVIDEGGTPANHSLTAPRLLPNSSVQATGVLALAFSGAPRRVSFRVRGQDVQDDQVVVTATNGDGGPVNAAMVASSYQSACCGIQRQATVSVEDAGSGVAEVRIVFAVDAGNGRGGPIYVDNVRIVR